MSTSHLSAFGNNDDGRQSRLNSNKIVESKLSDNVVAVVIVVSSEFYFID